MIHQLTILNGAGFVKKTANNQSFSTNINGNINNGNSSNNHSRNNLSSNCSDKIIFISLCEMDQRLCYVPRIYVMGCYWICLISELAE